ncbi:translation initiation factor EIF-2B subunit, putative [Plasmodium malariae]|uniref:Translation initiation factor EIF-2B subunit, putative n=1 Tax=Plasmodium malariae TaxID=5858 RepID=A0A1A8WAF1_PLAMA|nr:translation initiation factor EIF-2B subunit, putative [Plasmodium malariae]
MVSYDDITQTLLIDRIKIQYDSSSQWNKYLKYSLRNPHSFTYPESSHLNSCNIIRKGKKKIIDNADFNYFNSAFLSKGYKLNNVDKLNRDYDEEKGERYLFEVEKYEEENLNKDEDILIRKIVCLFKECMYYFMSFNEKDGQVLEKSFRNTNKKDIKDSSAYELLKSLNDCIVQLHDSKIKKNQALIMTSEFCGIFTPKYVKLTKYSDSFLNLLKENNIKYFDLFYEEIKYNDLYKHKKEHYDFLKNSSFVPLTKGEISLANKKNALNNNLHNIKKKDEENVSDKKYIASENYKYDKNKNCGSGTVLIKNNADAKGENERGKKKKKKKKGKEVGAGGKVETEVDIDVDSETEKQLDCSENEKRCCYTNVHVPVKGEENTNNRIAKETTDDVNNGNCRNKKGDKGIIEHSDNRKTKKKRKREDDKKKFKVNKKKRKNEKVKTKKGKNSVCSEMDNRTVNDTVNNHVNSAFNDEKRGEELGLVLYENEEICNYLNIKNENKEIGKNEYRDINNNNEKFAKNVKIFNLLNKRIDAKEYIYNELKSDFMKEINLPNKFNYDVNVIEIFEKDVKNFYRCVVKHINKKKEKIKIYYIISNFLFFFSKMHKNTINFDDNIHKDINRNFDYKSIIIQGNMLPYNFYLLLKALHLMSVHELVKNFYINVDYDERKNKCLHFLNISENKFYENFKKFEKNIKSNFIYVHKFLHNMIPINKFLISKGNLYKNLENLPFSFENNDLLQLAYNNKSFYHNNDALVLYDENSNNDDVKNNFIGNNTSTSAVIPISGLTNAATMLCNASYIIYDCTNAHKGIENLKRNCKIIDDKELHKIMIELTDLNDNYTKILLKEKKILFLVESYGNNNTLFDNLLFNSIFFDTYISLICVYYINNYVKKVEDLKHIPLFKPSYFNLLVNQIKRRKNQKKMKKHSGKNEHTVDKLCNNFFKNSFNKILSSKIEEERTVDIRNANLLRENMNIQGEMNEQGEMKEEDSLNGTDNKNKIHHTTNDINIDTSKNKEYINSKSDNNGPEKSMNNLNNSIKAKGEQKNLNENENSYENYLQDRVSNIIINEAVVTKKEFNDFIICIFVFINENSSSVSEEEKEMRELILYVLKIKENENVGNKLKCIFKYRNNISDAITLSEIEIRKYDYAKICIMGLILNNDISNPNLQTDINNLYYLNEALHQKYFARKFEIQTKIFTFYWIYDVHVYGSIFLKKKEVNHMIRKVGSTYQLPYRVEWKSKLLWGYYFYIIQDSVESKYSEEVVLKLREEGINIKLCSEQFDVKYVEEDIKEILNMHNLEFKDLKYLNKNTFMNIIFLIENGHLTYFSFINTDNIHIYQRNNYLCIQLFKTKITFPSFSLNTPLLNDSWLIDVLSKQTLLPFNDYFYKF